MLWTIIIQDDHLLLPGYRSLERFDNVIMCPVESRGHECESLRTLTFHVVCCVPSLVRFPQIVDKSAILLTT